MSSLSNKTTQNICRNIIVILIHFNSFYILLRIQILIYIQQAIGNSFLLQHARYLSDSLKYIDAFQWPRTAGSHTPFQAKLEPIHCVIQKTFLQLVNWILIAKGSLQPISLSSPAYQIQNVNESHLQYSRRKIAKTDLTAISGSANLLFPGVVRRDSVPSLQYPKLAMTVDLRRRTKWWFQ